MITYKKKEYNRFTSDSWNIYHKQCTVAKKDIFAKFDNI